MTDDLIEFLRARFNEDEAAASAAAKKVSAPPNPGLEWRRDWDTVFTAPSDPPGPRMQVASCGHGGADLTAYIERHDPARVLREIRAKRAIVAKYEYWNSMADKDGIEALSHWHRGERHGWWNACRELATVYADHPDYRQEWAIDPTSPA